MHAGEQEGLDDGSVQGRIGLRGLLVIITAIAIGAFVLARGLDDSTEDAVAASANGSESSSIVRGDGTVQTTIPGATIGSTVAGVTGSTTGLNDGSTASTAPALTESTTSAPVTTSPAGPGIAGPGGVTVLVLNAAKEKGVAGKGAEILDGEGYDVMAPKNADALGPSRILFTTGHDADAAAVAAVFSADPKLVGPLDVSAPPISDFGDAEVIVVVGSDGLIDVLGG
jgi:hypothetical protein